MSLQLVDLFAKTDALANAVLARRTLNGYASDWEIYAAWCRLNGRSSIPAEPGTVPLYLADCLETCKIRTARRHLCAILHYHRVKGHTIPDLIRASAILTGAQRLRHEKPLQKAAVSVEQLREMIRAAGRPGQCGVRDRTILAFGFTTALRRSSIAAVRLEHLAFTPAGMTVYVPHEKQDQAGKGRIIGVPFARDPEICAAGCVRRWLAARGDEPGWLFPGMDKHGNLQPDRPMCQETIAHIVQRAAESIGLDPDRYGAHSLRAGFVTSALEAGAGEILTARHTGHRSLATLRVYMRPEDPFRGNVCSVIGL